jgi:hypothetical protein
MVLNKQTQKCPITSCRVTTYLGHRKSQNTSRFWRRVVGLPEPSYEKAFFSCSPLAREEIITKPSVFRQISRSFLFGRE